MSSRAPVVLITGATGALGGAALRAFEAAGWRIRTMSRRASSPAAYPHFAGEIDNREVLRRAMHGVDTVVHMAALLHVFEPSPAIEDEYRRVNVGGTAAVAEVAAAAGVKRIVFASSIAVYGPRVSPVGEDAAPAPETFYGTTKLEAEHHVLEARDQDGSPLGCVLRLAAVYGPSVKGNYERLVRALARRRFISIGSSQNLRTLVFEDDAAAAMVLAATRDAAAGRFFNVTDGTVHTVGEIVDAISHALGRRPPKLAVPLGVARLGVGMSEVLFGLAGMKSPLTTATLEKYVESVAVSGERIQQELGFHPRWELEDGWRQTVRRLREEGRL